MNVEYNFGKVELHPTQGVKYWEYCLAFYICGRAWKAEFNGIDNSILTKMWVKPLYVWAHESLLSADIIYNAVV